MRISANANLVGKELHFLAFPTSPFKRGYTIPNRQWYFMLGGLRGPGGL